ncbi:MAG: signal peptidase I [Chloroflexi bacterium]|nr:signal peptidase I [Chloroflexota bacterium]
MQGGDSAPARAVIRVVPDRAACYWKAISEVLERAGAQTSNLEVNVLEPSPESAQGARQGVDLEMRCAGLDQAVLDEAVRYACSVCDGAAQSARTDSPSKQSTNGESKTRWAPVEAGPRSTVEEPLLPRAVATIHAPLFAKASMAARESVHEPDRAAVAEPATAAVGPSADVPVSQPTARSALRAHAIEVFNAVAIVVVLAIGLRLIVQTFSVDGPSMRPTFETDQRLLINRAAYWHVDGTPFDGLVPATHQGSVAYVFGGPHRGDVVVFRPPGEAGFQSDLIKRVIGLPGDTVSIQSGQVLVNGQPLVEPYVQFVADYTFPDRDLAVLVPNDSYFVLGDNRPVSVDSHFGWVVPADKLVGEAWISYWPISQLGIVPGGQISIGS